MSFIREADSEPIPGYRLIKPLGSGGFGEVWLCEAPGNLKKAIKFVFGNLDSSLSSDGRARQEFGALQRFKEVRHPFVLSIERIDILDGEVVIVMELADKNLHDVMVEMRNAGRSGIPREMLLRFMSDAADGLDFLSESHNLMHLDVKPRNLFIVGNHVKVADFGLARQLERASATGIIAGISPQYAAPETFASRITKSSDQYSLAIVFVEMMTGSRPFKGKTIRDLAYQHMSAIPDLTGLSDHDRGVVSRALAKDPTERFPNCRAFVESLSSGSGSGAIPTSRAADSTQGFENTPATLHVAEDVASELKRWAEKRPNIRPESATTDPQTADAEVPIAEAVPVDDHSIPSSQIAESQRVSFDFPETDGVLRPTLVIGLGRFGLLALRELRSRLTDRVGELKNFPSVRFLYADADPEAKSIGTAGAADRALSADQIFPMQLQPVTRYRRSSLQILEEWLPKEKMHAMPRTLTTNGSRALGRLAFTENYLRFVTRCRRDLEIACHPESLTLSADASGLTVRDRRPRAIVIAAAGGAMSGAMVDIGYALSDALQRMKAPPAVFSFLFLGAPADPTTPPEESANVLATLTELNHYGNDELRFSARYGGPDGPSVDSRGRPFQAVYLTQRGSRGPSAQVEGAERIGAFVNLDITTPLGRELDRLRSRSRCEMFQGFGSGGIWYPRGLFLRAAARRVCERLAEQWQSSSSAIPAGVDELCRKVTSSTELKGDHLKSELDRLVREGSDGGDWLTGTLDAMERRIPEAEGAGPIWSRDAFDEVINLVGVRGSRDPAHSVRTGRLSRDYATAVTSLGEHVAKRLAAAGLTFVERPGRRTASAEAALARLIEYCETRENDSHRGTEELLKRSESAFATAHASAEVCRLGGGFSLFGNKEHRQMRTLMTALREYCKRRLEEESGTGLERLFKKIKAVLEDVQRDLTICRRRLTQLRQSLEAPETAGASLAGVSSPVSELLLPDGGSEIEWAARRFVETLTTARFEELDGLLQSLVLDPRGGLLGVCRKPGDAVVELVEPLIDQTTSFLETLLSVREVTQFPLGTDGWRQRLSSAYRTALPMVGGGSLAESSYMIMPEAVEGAESARSAAGEYVHSAQLDGGKINEVTFCRVSDLRPADLVATMAFAREPFESAARRPASSPHSRFDVMEWLPLFPD